MDPCQATGSGHLDTNQKHWRPKGEDEGMPGSSMEPTTDMCSVEKNTLFLILKAQSFGFSTEDWPTLVVTKLVRVGKLYCADYPV